LTLKTETALKSFESQYKQRAQELEEQYRAETAKVRDIMQAGVAAISSSNTDDHQQYRDQLQEAMSEVRGLLAKLEDALTTRLDTLNETLQTARQALADEYATRTHALEASLEEKFAGNRLLLAAEIQKVATQYEQNIRALDERGALLRTEIEKNFAAQKKQFAGLENRVHTHLAQATAGLREMQRAAGAATSEKLDDLRRVVDDIQGTTGRLEGSVQGIAVDTATVRDIVTRTDKTRQDKLASQLGNMRQAVSANPEFAQYFLMQLQNNPDMRKYFQNNYSPAQIQQLTDAVQQGLSKAPQLTHGPALTRLEDARTSAGGKRFEELSDAPNTPDISALSDRQQVLQLTDQDMPVRTAQDQAITLVGESRVPAQHIAATQYPQKPHKALEKPEIVDWVTKKPLTLEGASALAA